VSVESPEYWRDQVTTLRASLSRVTAELADARSQRDSARDAMIIVAHAKHEALTELAEAREALRDAAASLTTIAEHAGKDEYLSDMLQVRGYANSRAGVARALLARQAPDKGASGTGMSGDD
jgi:chromosome segregation ATPase